MHIMLVPRRGGGGCLRPGLWRSQQARGSPRRGGRAALGRRASCGVWRSSHVRTLMPVRRRFSGVVVAARTPAAFQRRAAASVPRLVRSTAGLTQTTEVHRRRRGGVAGGGFSVSTSGAVVAWLVALVVFYSQVCVRG